MEDKLFFSRGIEIEQFQSAMVEHDIYKDPEG
jgi:hypothetical protein